MTRPQSYARYRLVRLVGAVANLQEFCTTNGLRLTVNLQAVKEQLQDEITRLETSPALPEPKPKTPLWPKL